MFKTILWDPAGALMQCQPDGNEVERVAEGWRMGNLLSSGEERTAVTQKYMLMCTYSVKCRL